MKKTLLALSLLFAFSLAKAQPCTRDYADTYVAPGFSCTIGNATFSNFTVSGSFAADQILVVPASGASFFIHPVGGWTSNTSTVIGFTVSGNLTGAAANMTGYEYSGSGGVRVTSTGLPGNSQFDLVDGANGVVWEQSEGFSQVPSIDFTATVSTFGDASVQDVAFGFTATDRPFCNQLVAQQTEFVLGWFKWQRNSSRQV